MNKVLIMRFNKVEKELLDNIKKEISKKLNAKVDVYKEIVNIPKCRKRNNQLNGEDFLPIIRKIVGREKYDCGLGITDKDLYVEKLNFIFGLAYIHSCIISLKRLKSPDKKKYYLRAVKEAVHELGHLFGLHHCKNTKCVMHFSNCLEDTDIKNKDFCDKCNKLLCATERTK